MTKILRRMEEEQVLWQEIESLVWNMPFRKFARVHIFSSLYETCVRFIFRVLMCTDLSFRKIILVGG